MYGEPATRSDLDRVRSDLEYEMRRLAARVEQLENDLRRERDARREEVEGMWAELGNMRN